MVEKLTVIGRTEAEALAEIFTVTVQVPVEPRVVTLSCPTLWKLLEIYCRILEIVMRVILTVGMEIENTQLIANTQGGVVEQDPMPIDGRESGLDSMEARPVFG